MKRALAIAFASLLFACGTSTDEIEDDVQPDSDSTVLPEYELKLDGDLTFAASAFVSSPGAEMKSSLDPDIALEVDDFVPVVYEASLEDAGASAHARVEVTRGTHSMTFRGQATASAPTKVAAVAKAELTINGVCVKARGAKKFRITFSCEGTRSGGGVYAIASINGAEGAITLCNTNLERLEGANRQDNGWDPQSNSYESDAMDGTDCFRADAQLTFLAAGGSLGSDPGGGNASSEGSITLTVEPIY